MKHQILIGFEPGSTWQEEIQLEKLNLILETWKYHVEGKHRKNVVEIVFTENAESKRNGTKEV